MAERRRRIARRRIGARRGGKDSGIMRDDEDDDLKVLCKMLRLTMRVLPL